MNNSIYFKVEFLINSFFVIRILWDFVIFVLVFFGVNILVVMFGNVCVLFMF